MEILAIVLYVLGVFFFLGNIKKIAENGSIISECTTEITVMYALVWPLFSIVGLIMATLKALKNVIPWQ